MFFILEKTQQSTYVVYKTPLKNDLPTTCVHIKKDPQAVFSKLHHFVCFNICRYC